MSKRILVAVVWFWTLVLAGSPNGSMAEGNPADKGGIAVGKAPFHPIEELIPEAKQSIYSSRVFKVLKKWPPAEFPEIAPITNPIWTRGIETPDHATYIGTAKRVWIKAPLKVVSDMIENFETYTQLVRELKKVEVLARDGNKVTTFFERKSPVFFVPNIKYEQIYIFDHISKDRVVVRYQLKSANSINYCDGIIILEWIGGVTRLTAFDFFDGSYGILGAIAAGKIWHETLEGSYRGDVAFKARAEHPDWTYEQVTQESERMLERFPVDPIRYLKLDW